MHKEKGRIEGRTTCMKWKVRENKKRRKLERGRSQGGEEGK